MSSTLQRDCPETHEMAVTCLVKSGIAIQAHDDAIASHLRDLQSRPDWSAALRNHGIHLQPAHLLSCLLVNALRQGEAIQLLSAFMRYQQAHRQAHIRKWGSSGDVLIEGKMHRHESGYC